MYRHMVDLGLPSEIRFMRLGIAERSILEVGPVLTRFQEGGVP